jgi:CheY-like chemotaxis protein
LRFIDAKVPKGDVLPDLPVILAVEDEELLQTVVHDALEEGGFDVVISASADEALTLFHSGVAKYSALVSDVNLKGAKNGWELAREVREINPAFPVVYVTGTAADEWASQGVPNSILLQKPFAPAQLITAVSQLLNTDGTTT